MMEKLVINAKLDLNLILNKKDANGIAKALKENIGV